MNMIANAIDAIEGKGEIEISTINHLHTVEIQIKDTGTGISEEDKKKHADFVSRMVEKGYTEKQVRLLCEWYLRVRKAS